MKVKGEKEMSDMYRSKTMDKISESDIGSQSC